jgi:hypothetical protein
MLMMLTGGGGRAAVRRRRGVATVDERQRAQLHKLRLIVGMPLHLHTRKNRG